MKEGLNNNIFDVRSACMVLLHIVLVSIKICKRCSLYWGAIEVSRS